MEKITWKYVKPLKEKNIVKKFLNRQGVELPEKLTEFIMEHNGGRPSQFLFDTDKGSEYVFQSLFSYNLEDKCNIYDIYEDIFANESTYPIGLEAAGNIVCYDLTSCKYVLWNHENSSYETIIRSK